METLEVKLYSEDIEDKALEQFWSACALPCVKKAALMPDAHAGYALPIGAVVGAKDYIFPAWVGYDIGCGMGAIGSNFSRGDVERNKDKIFDEIYNNLPVGTQVHDGKRVKSIPGNLTPEGNKIFEERRGWYNIGTLGGGNHFVEIGYNHNEQVVIIVHSGSRGVGHGIAGHYMKLAARGEKNIEGHYGFHEESEEGKAYLNDMKWCEVFAERNRYSILVIVEAAIRRYCNGYTSIGSLINKSHNHVQKENGLWVHRKGATQASKEMLGVIPGNMRDGSFIVSGLGNPDSLFSSSHGAGRVLGRKEAKRKLELEDFKKTMVGIKAKVSEKTLDEAPAAYKSIFQVMRDQKDLVRIVSHIKPIINIKAG